MCQVIGYAIESAALPFPAFVLGYAINGIGMALQVGFASVMDSAAQMNVSSNRMRKRMDLLQVSRITPRRKWESFTR